MKSYVRTRQNLKMKSVCFDVPRRDLGRVQVRVCRRIAKLLPLGVPCHLISAYHGGFDMRMETREAETIVKKRDARIKLYILGCKLSKYEDYESERFFLCHPPPFLRSLDSWYAYVLFELWDIWGVEGRIYEENPELEASFLTNIFEVRSFYVKESYENHTRSGKRFRKRRAPRKILEFRETMEICGICDKDMTYILERYDFAVAASVLISIIDAPSPDWPNFTEDPNAEARHFFEAMCVNTLQPFGLDKYNINFFDRRFFEDYLSVCKLTGGRNHSKRTKN